MSARTIRCASSMLLSMGRILRQRRLSMLSQGDRPLGPGRRSPEAVRGKFALDLYGALPVKRLFWVRCQFFVRSGKAVLHPVACDQVRGGTMNSERAFLRSSSELPQQ